MVRTKIFGRKTFVSGTREFVYIYNRCQRFIYVNKLSCTTDEGLTTENFGSYHYTILHQNRTLSSFLSIHYWCGKHIFISIYCIFVYLYLYGVLYMFIYLYLCVYLYVILYYIYICGCIYAGICMYVCILLLFISLFVLFCLGFIVTS